MKPKITIGKYSGFCFGVKRAYDLTCMNSKNCTDIYILGKLVHNNDVCADLRKRGIKETKSIDEIKKGSVIFTAHGVGPKSYDMAEKRGLEVIDATCPKVMKVQRLAKVHAEKGFQILAFGDKDHKEVRGIQEWSEKKAIVFSSLEELKRTKLNFLATAKKLSHKKYCLVSQTTQNAEEFKKIVKYLSEKIGKNFVYFNTICESTNDRQKEIRQLAKKNDLVIIIGGQDSANSKMLYEISKKINPKSYFIENAKQLKKSWLSGIKKVAISAGASTPDWVIGDVVKKLQV